MSRRRKLGIALLVVASAWLVAALLPPPNRPLRPYFAGTEDRVLVVAHRGGAEVAPESTLPLYRHVADLGVDVLELDVHRTADSVLVVIHDRRVDRVTEGTGRIDDLDLAQLQALDAGYDWSSDGGTSYPYRGQGLRIPTLVELLSAFPEHRLLIELKRGTEGSEAGLCGHLRDHGRTARTIVASFRVEALRAFRAACPEVATSAASREVTVYLLLHRLRLDTLYEPDFDALHVPMEAGPLTIVDEAFVRRAHARGLPVEVWTINREEEMRRLIDLGVRGIMTDRPDLLLEILREADRDG